jgi:hypothetical protein
MMMMATMTTMVPLREGRRQRRRPSSGTEFLWLSRNGSISFRFLVWQRLALALLLWTHIYNSFHGCPNFDSNTQYPRMRWWWWQMPLGGAAQAAIIPYQPPLLLQQQQQRNLVQDTTWDEPVSIRQPHTNNYLAETTTTIPAILSNCILIHPCAVCTQTDRTHILECSPTGRIETYRCPTNIPADVVVDDNDNNNHHADERTVVRTIRSLEEINSSSRQQQQQQQQQPQDGGGGLDQNEWRIHDTPNTVPADSSSHVRTTSSSTTTSIQYRTCRRTINEEEFMFIQFQVACAFLGFLSIYSIRKQKMHVATLFDQRRMNVVPSSTTETTGGGSSSSSSRNNRRRLGNHNNNNINNNHPTNHPEDGIEMIAAAATTTATTRLYNNNNNNTVVNLTKNHNHQHSTKILLRQSSLQLPNNNNNHHHHHPNDEMKSLLQPSTSLDVV